MKVDRIYIAIFLFAFWGKGFPSFAMGEKRALTYQEYVSTEKELVASVSGYIKNICAREQEKNEKIIDSLKKENPSLRIDSSSLEVNRLKAQSFWKGPLGVDTLDINWIVYYRCYDSAFLVIFKDNPKTGKVLLWQSKGMFSVLGAVAEPEDLNKDGRKEIMLKTTGGSAMNMILDLYTWDGNTAHFIRQFSGEPLEVKDVDGDGLKEIVEHERPYPGDVEIDDRIYKWDGTTYKLSETKRKPVVKDDK